MTGSSKPRVFTPLIRLVVLVLALVLAVVRDRTPLIVVFAVLAFLQLGDVLAARLKRASPSGQDPPSPQGFDQPR